jgi:hypothetical protein
VARAVSHRICTMCGGLRYFFISRICLGACVWVCVCECLCVCVCVRAIAAAGRVSFQRPRKTKATLRAGVWDGLSLHGTDSTDGHHHRGWPALRTAPVFLRALRAVPWLCWLTETYGASGVRSAQGGSVLGYSRLLKRYLVYSRLLKGTQGTQTEASASGV